MFLIDELIALILEFHQTNLLFVFPLHMQIGVIVIVGVVMEDESCLLFIYFPMLIAGDDFIEMFDMSILAFFSLELQRAVF